jgi:repressor LexA
VGIERTQHFRRIIFHELGYSGFPQHIWEICDIPLTNERMFVILHSNICSNADTAIMGGLMILSERQERILAFIRQYGEDHGFPPTIREIGKAVGITSTSVVKYNLERLEDKGKLERSDEISRGLRLKDNLPAARREALSPTLRVIPKLGIISAGAPIPAAGQQEHPFGDDVLTLTQDMVPAGGDLYALQVKGDSMIDALVYDGDWVIIRHQNTAQPRDMVVAWIKDREETTLKYYLPDGDIVRLQPANPAYQSIPVPASQLEIQGKVVAVFRQLA